MRIEKRSFIKRKYGRELLFDCCSRKRSKSELPKYPFVTDFYGISFVTKGCGSISIDNSMIRFKKGSLIFFQPNQVKQWQDVSYDLDGYYLIFMKEFIETFFQDNLFIYRFQFFHNSGISNTLECEQDFFDSLINSCKAIDSELDNLQEDSHHFLRSILYNILIQINRKYIEQYNLSGNLFQNNAGLEFKKLLEDKIGKYHRVEDYSGFLKISRAHLNNISKKAFGFPVSEIIKDRLLIEIKRELLFTDKTIKEICFEMNFSDVSNFVRFFKKHTGINPHEYRTEYTK